MELEGHFIVSGHADTAGEVVERTLDGRTPLPMCTELLGNLGGQVARNRTQLARRRHEKRSTRPFLTAPAD